MSKGWIAWRETVGKLIERSGVPQLAERVVPHNGTTHAGVARACRTIWSPYTSLFPRTCEFCIHFDHDLGQRNLAGQTVESEVEGANLVAQRLLIGDYIWDVDGKEVRIEPRELGACKRREAYTTKEGSCDDFARTASGSLNSCKRPGYAEPAASPLTGWRRASVNPSAGDQGSDQGGDRTH